MAKGRLVALGEEAGYGIWVSSNRNLSTRSLSSVGRSNKREKDEEQGSVVFIAIQMRLVMALVRADPDSCHVDIEIRPNSAVVAFLFLCNLTKYSNLGFHGEYWDFVAQMVMAANASIPIENHLCKLFRALKQDSEVKQKVSLYQFRKYCR